MTEPAAIEPEYKDWTFVIERGCAECGFDAGRVNAPEVAGRLRATVPRWTAVYFLHDIEHHLYDVHG